MGKVRCMEHPARVRRLCQRNYTLTYAIDFLYQDGMPYCTLRQFNRMSATPRRRLLIDRFCEYYCCRFRATNKYLYAMLAYHYERDEGLFLNFIEVVLCKITVCVLGAMPPSDTP